MRINKCHSKYVLLYCLFICFQGCSQSNRKIETYDEYRTQKLEFRDSLFVIHTVKEWHNRDWFTFADYSRMYKMTNDELSYFIGGAFYSPDKLKLIVWVGEKKPNALTRIAYNKGDTTLNKICPLGDDTIYSMGAIIGYREDTGKMWQLYPLSNQLVSCFNSPQEVIHVMEQYYFSKMKDHQMWKIVQGGKGKGTFELKAYGYNLNDDGFWNKCWLWEIDTVGSTNLYPFQVKSYGYGMKETCFKCADSVVPPAITYPNKITRLYTIQVYSTVLKYRKHSNPGWNRQASLKLHTSTESPAIGRK